MIRRAIPLIVLGGLVCMTAIAQETPSSIVATYDSLADAIIALKNTEADLVRALLGHHRVAARAAMESGDYATAAAELALFANEGDNAIGGIRKRLVDAGHHHHAAGEAEGIYEEGYVVVTRAAKQQILEASAALRQASSDAERNQAWDRFEEIAQELLGS